MNILTLTDEGARRAIAERHEEENNKKNLTYQLIILLEMSSNEQARPDQPISIGWWLQLAAAEREIAQRNVIHCLHSKCKYTERGSHARMNGKLSR